MIAEQALNSKKLNGYSPDLNEQDWLETSDLFKESWSGKLEILRNRINDENYLYAAIQRLALVLSNELMNISSEGGRNEQRKRRK